MLAQLRAYKVLLDHAKENYVTQLASIFFASYSSCKPLNFTREKHTVGNLPCLFNSRRKTNIFKIHIPLISRRQFKAFLKWPRVFLVERAKSDEFISLAQKYKHHTTVKINYQQNEKRDRLTESSILRTLSRYELLPLTHT